MKPIFRMLAAFTASLTLCSAAMGSETFPSKPLRLVVAFTAGGANDLIARLLAEPLSAALGQPVVVENKPGANGLIASEYVATSAPDGHTLLIGGGPQVVGPVLFKSFNLSPKDFTAIGNIVKAPAVIVTAPDFPASDGKELIELAKSKPGSLSYAATSSFFLLCFERINYMAGTDLLRVPYKGVSTALNDVVAGRVSVMIDVIGAQLPHIKAGRTKPIAVIGAQRHPALPNVPTVMEAGLHGYDEDGYIGLLGPAGMPAPLVSRLNAELNKILDNHVLRGRFDSMGFVTTSSTPQEFGSLLVAQLDRYSKIATQAGIQPE